MEAKFKFGDVVFHKSDPEKSTPMVIIDVKLREPAQWENPVTFQINKEEFEPYFSVTAEWLNTQKVIRSHVFRESDFQEITN